MINNELLALLRLQSIPNIGDIRAKRLIEACGSPSAIFSDKRSALLKIEGIGRQMVADLAESRFEEAALKELDFIEKNHIRYCSYKDPDYPGYLKHCADGPILLFYRGDIPLHTDRIISVVGTRRMTSYGEAFCHELIEQLAPLDPVIISGFAYGIDITVQRAAIRQGLRTVSCLAHGLNRVYPRPHLAYVSEVLEKGALCTEFWSTSKPDRENFLRRNRIIAGMSMATLVVESAEQGGSLVTADFAQGYNREVFAVPGRVGDPLSMGCNNLIKTQRAHLISSAADLVYLLNWELQEPHQKGVQRRLFVELEGEENEIYKFLQDVGKESLDLISITCGIPVFRASSLLLGMEMKGVIRPLPGKYFELA